MNDRRRFGEARFYRHSPLPTRSFRKYKDNISTRAQPNRSRRFTTFHSPIYRNFHARAHFHDPFKVPYHCRPDISPQRIPTRRIASPKRTSLRSSVSKSFPSHENKVEIMPRRLAIIGNFGRPIYHQPNYDVSPDRTASASGNILADLEEIAEDRDQLFEKMLQAKKSENLDEYYRLRDLLNAFDLRNPQLAYRRSNYKLEKKKQYSTTTIQQIREEGIDDQQQESNDVIDPSELEEIDCSELTHIKTEVLNMKGDNDAVNMHGKNNEYKEQKQKDEGNNQDQGKEEEAGGQEEIELDYDDLGYYI